MYLIVATVAAILVFLGLYTKTVSEYFVLLGQVRPLINGSFKCGFLYCTILLAGQYKGREIVCGLEQLKEGADALSVKIRLRDALPEKTPFNSQELSNKIVLSGGWLMPRFYISKDKFNPKSFMENIDKLSLVCDNLERQIRMVANNRLYSSKVGCRVD